MDRPAPGLTVAALAAGIEAGRRGAPAQPPPDYAGPHAQSWLFGHACATGHPKARAGSLGAPPGPPRRPAVAGTATLFDLAEDPS